jgi:hypothetical protein
MSEIVKQLIGIAENNPAIVRIKVDVLTLEAFSPISKFLDTEAGPSFGYCSAEEKGQYIQYNGCIIKFIAKY